MLVREVVSLVLAAIGGDRLISGRRLMRLGAGR
jgi:hypothetical protein